VQVRFAKWLSLDAVVPAIRTLKILSSQVTNHQQQILHCAKSNSTVKNRKKEPLSSKIMRVRLAVSVCVLVPFRYGNMTVSNSKQRCMVRYNNESQVIDPNSRLFKLV
jgi:hypothetical protein